MKIYIQATAGTKIEREIPIITDAIAEKIGNRLPSDVETGEREKILNEIFSVAFAEWYRVPEDIAIEVDGESW